MNLYRVLVMHIAPKDSCTSVLGYFKAKDETELFRQFANIFYLEDVFGPDYKPSEDPADDMHPLSWYLKNKGNWEEDYISESWQDAYYGNTFFRWEIVKRDILEEDIKVLERLGIFEPLEILKDRTLMMSTAEKHFDYQEKYR